MAVPVPVEVVNLSKGCRECKFKAVFSGQFLQDCGRVCCDCCSQKWLDLLRELIADDF